MHRGLPRRHLPFRQVQAIVLSLWRKALSQVVKLHRRVLLATALQSFGVRLTIYWRPLDNLLTTAERYTSLDAQANELGGLWHKDEETLSERKGKNYMTTKEEKKAWANYQLSPEILKISLKNHKLVSDSIEDSLEDSLEEKYR